MRYLYNYYWISIKRFLLQSFLIAIFQYIIIMSMTFSAPELPAYPPMGLAFSFFYLLGGSAFWGLLLGGFSAYFLKGLSLSSMFLYLTADIGAGFVGATLCQTILTADVRTFTNLSEFFRFIKVNALMTTVVSSMLRMTAFLLSQQDNINIKILLFYYIDLWLADLNGILVVSGLLLSWIYVPFSREKILQKSMKKIPLAALVACLFLSLFLFKKVIFLYFILAFMLGSIVYLCDYGYLAATALLFINATFYLAYFIGFKSYYVQTYGLQWYTLAPVILLLFMISILVNHHSSQKNKRTCA
jgi:hypothetical protein